MQAEHEEMLAKIEVENKQKLEKSARATRIMICMQNRVREMLAEKLADAAKSIELKEKEVSSLREDLDDVT